MDEKVWSRAGARFNAVGFCLTGIRIWQWSSAFFAYASFSLLNPEENERMKAVEILVCWMFHPLPRPQVPRDIASHESSSS